MNSVRIFQQIASGKLSVGLVFAQNACLSLWDYSSKTTLTDYQCVSTGCCTHVIKTEITIDNQHVINIIAKV